MCLLTIFKRAIPSKKSTTPTCLGSYERLSRPTAQNWQKEKWSQHTRFCFQWLLCIMYSMAAVALISLTTLLIWHYMIIICSPTRKGTWLGSSIAGMLMSYLLFMNCLTNKMKASPSKHCNINRSNVWPARKTMFKNKLHLISFHKDIYVNYQPFFQLCFLSHTRCLLQRV